MTAKGKGVAALFPQDVTELCLAYDLNETRSDRALYLHVLGFQQPRSLIHLASEHCSVFFVIRVSQTKS